MADYRKVEIWDATNADNPYIGRMNLNESIQHNRSTSSQITLGSKYPFHIHNGQSSYYSGSCTATFVDNNDCYITSEQDVAEFNYRIAEWLHNDLVKYLRYSDKTIFPVGILETVKIESNNTVNDPYTVAVSFDWEQIEDAIIS